MSVVRPVSRAKTIEKLKKGEPVTVLARINLDKHEVGEPAQWAKITLPSSTQCLGELQIH